MANIVMENLVKLGDVLKYVKISATQSADLLFCGLLISFLCLFVVKQFLAVQKYTIIYIHSLFRISKHCTNVAFNRRDWVSPVLCFIKYICISFLDMSIYIISAIFIAFCDGKNS